MVYVKCNSHRARERLLAMLLTRNPQRDARSYYSMKRVNGKWYRAAHQGIYCIDESEVAAARQIKGVSVLRKPYDDLSPCWS